LESVDFSIREQGLMIPIPGARARAPFPYVGLATAIVLLHAILVAVVPPNPYRAVFALAALFSVGYCTLALIVGLTIRLSAAEILAFSTGLTIFITSLSALGVSILGIPITVFAVVIVGLPIALGATLVLRPRGNPLAAFTNFTRAILDFSDYSAAEKGAGAVIVRIRLVPSNATGNETFHKVLQTSPLRMDAFAEYSVSIVLGPRETWSQQFSISIEQAGDFELKFALLDATSRVVAENLLA